MRENSEIDFWSLRKVTPPGALPRCPHGVYDPHQDGHYCTVCNPIRIPLDVPTRRVAGCRSNVSESGIVVVAAKHVKLPDPLAMYRSAIRKALSSARTKLRATNPYQRVSKRPDQESEKNFRDLRSLAEFEVWKALKLYGSEMTLALAYTIAHNTAQKYLRDLIEDNSVLVGLDLAFASPELRQRAEALLDQCGDIEALERLSNDHRADSEDRKLAKQIIKQYGTRIPRFESMDVPAEFDKNDRTGGDTTSAAEYEFHENQRKEAQRVPDPDEMLDMCRPALEALVGTWDGDIRLVGEAMLSDSFTVRGVPGVDKSKVSRLRTAIIEEFRGMVQDLLLK